MTGFWKLLRTGGCTAVAAAAMCAWTASAQAAQFTIDSHAASIGPIVTDAAGNGYIAWEDGASPAGTPMFCKLAPGATKCAHPVALALPGGTQNAENGALALFPILGPGQTVWVVTDRYVRDDTVIWTSTNGGVSFGAPADIPYGNVCNVGASCEDSVPYTNLTGLSDTIPVTDSGAPYAGQSYIDATGQPDVAFLQSSNNPGLGWDWDATDVTDQFEPGVSEFTFSNAAPYVDIEDSALGVSSAGDVIEAYTSDQTANDSVQYFAYTPSAAHPSVFTATQSGWAGPVTFANSYAPRLADGKSGLFMVTGSGQTSTPQSIDLRRWDPATGTFAAPTRLGPIASAYDAEGGGLGENATTGELATVWPTQTADGTDLMTMLISVDGGTHFSPVQDVGTLADEYGGFGTARVAIADDGSGFVSWQDSRGLEVADLTPTAAQFSGLHLVGSSLPITLTCLDPVHACTAKLTLSVHSTTISQSDSISAGGTRALKLRLTPAALTGLGHGHPDGTLSISLSANAKSLYQLVVHPKL